MCTSDLNLHGTERLVVNLGFCFTEFIERSHLFKVFAIFADEHVAHGDVVFGVAGNDLDFIDRQRLAQVYGKVMILANSAATPEESIALAIECIFSMVRWIPRDVGVDMGITNQGRKRC